MHELALTQEILDIAESHAGQQRIKRIILEVGKLSCVSPEALLFNFEVCSAGTLAEGATLEIVPIPGRGQCRECGKELIMDAPLIQCPCGSTNVAWLAGNDIIIKAMEVL